MSEATNLRQADAKLEVVGILSENKLEEVTKDGKTFIKGDLVIQTGDINFITINVYANELKEDGTENKTYAGIKTVMNEFNSIAKVGKENATKVVIKDNYGQIRPRSYVGRDGQVHVGIRYQSMIIDRYKDAPDKFNPHAWFEIEMAIVQIAPEVYTTGEQKGEETGRAIVKGWMPVYDGGVEPMTLYAPAEDGIAEAIMDDYVPGNTVKFYGDIINSRAVIEDVIPVKIGKPRVKTRTVFKNEMVIANVSDAYGEDSETPTPEPYDMDAIKKAVADRELRLEEEKDKVKKPETTAAKPKTNRGLPTF